MARTKRKLKVGQSLSSGARVDADDERRRENRQFVLFTLVVPAVMGLVVLVLWLLQVWG